jgi:hypothetical protein
MNKNLLKRHFARLSTAKEAPTILGIVDAEVL